jgi:membrane protein
MRRFRLPKAQVLSGVAGSALGRWIKNGAISMGAALSFFTLLSLVPLLLIGFSVAGYIFGERAAQGELITQLPALVGDKAADEVDSLIRTFRYTQHQGWTAISYVVALIVGALSVFGELQRALERIWKTERSADAPSWWRFLVVKAFSIGMVLLIGLSFIGLIAAGALLNDVLRELKYVPPLNYLLGLLWDTLVFCGIASLFAVVFRYGPRQRVAWRDVWIGAIVTALLFTTGKVLSAMFLGHRPLTSGYGAAGFFIGLLLWIYYSSLIFLYGAEFTYAYSQISANTTAPAAQ